ncbi:MAG TPA: ABC transporter ATP-binding protein [Candidatus Coprenecus pullistercoris]|nr:ABC transporter ATP-binding protein [Candidatus Coprenecus pullistercoris]
MIRIDELTFSYRGRRVYDGLCTRFEKGTVYGLLGKNGAGKTTLLRLMAGLMECGGGKIEVNGCEPYRRKPEFLDRLYFVPESMNAPDIPVSDYAAWYGKFYSGYDGEALLKYLEEFEVDPHGRLSRLSFGQRKKALIAFALSLNAEVLLLDEPGNGLDIPSKLCLRRMLSKYAGPDRTVILSTHQVRDIEDIVDHVAVIDEGRLMLNASVSEIENKIEFVQSDRIMTDALFSEKVSDGYVNIMKRGYSVNGYPGPERAGGRQESAAHEEVGTASGNAGKAQSRGVGQLDLEVLFDACTIGGRSFVQYLTEISGRSREEVSYVL